MDFSEITQSIQNNKKEFTITILEATQALCVVIFVAGRGGSPVRHLPLLRVVAQHGCTVIAPHFEMLPSLTPTKEELNARIEQLETVLRDYSHSHQTLIGLGHSIGATLLLALAGGKALTFSGHGIGPHSIWKFERLALLAPSVDFFLHPGALQTVNTQIYLRNGRKDTVTPPSKALLLKQILEKQGHVDFLLDEEAGHFSYMDELPPQIEDSQSNREVFLVDLARNIAQFVTT
ncbi:hypothetical protein NAF17_14650 [Mucilaginibacter sp. RB4R14]|uniref:hypothetical protein n=1 Tax=Mucilaginibacter aurantiaciroseus TaxID=2949308 RepID=UPI002090A898|nr:hypothetical protein [Mucilaginibacter aurantiaciroseus]MCO5936780.1 hypothetical protein [Mucilaginibacter aurantiaciroseus]